MFIILKRILILALISSTTACYFQPKNEQLDFSKYGETSSNPSSLKNETYSTPPPTISDYFPCSQCHADMDVNTQRRELVDMHDDIVFNHDSENRWCLACHDAQNRDSLRLASGLNISFDDSYKLCGQCHGPKLRDWRLGIHGKRTGEWNGKKQYLLCVYCHDPHSPKFKALEPKPRPLRPDELKLDSLKFVRNAKK